MTTLIVTFANLRMRLKIEMVGIGLQFRTTVQSSPVQSSPVQSGPVRSSPVRPSPVQSGPVQSSPVQSSPVRPSPVQSGPVQSSPVQSSPVQWLDKIDDKLRGAAPENRTSATSIFMDIFTCLRDKYYCWLS